MIEYVINYGSFFAGIGFMIFFISIASIIFHSNKYIKINVEKENRYSVFEELVLNDMASKKGYDLEKEVLKRENRDKNTKYRKTIRRKIEEEAYEKMFGEKEKEDKKK